MAAHWLVNSLIKYLSRGHSRDVPRARQMQLPSSRGFYPRGRHISHQCLGSTRATEEKLWELGSGRSPHRRAIDASSSGGWEGCDSRGNSPGKTQEAQRAVDVLGVECGFQGLSERAEARGWVIRPGWRLPRWAVASPWSPSAQ